MKHDINAVMGFLFGNILMAMLTLSAVMIIGIAIYNWSGSTPAAMARNRLEIDTAQAQRKVEDAKWQRDQAVEHARLQLQARLRAAGDSAADVQQAARIFAAEYHRIQEEHRRQQDGGSHG